MNQETNPTPKKRNSRPVVTYILILFTAAFFLLTFSLLANQRSNDQTLDELRQSISSLEEGQTAQSHALTLQEELDILQDDQYTLLDEIEALEAENTAISDEYDALTAQYNCLELLFQLEMQFQAQAYTDCLSIMQAMTDDNLVELLPTTGNPSPAQRYETIKLAVLNP